MLTLHPWGYDWQFVPIAPGSFTDSGSDLCHPQVPPPPVVPEPDRVAPVISKLSLSPKRFSRSTMMRYELSEAARVRITIRRKTRRGYRVVGRFSQLSSAGANRRRFRGRIGKRRLKAGTFRAGFKAVDAVGNRSQASSRAFKIVR